jgi:hypothetical protein
VSEPDPLIAEIRARVAFGHMVVAVLIGAGLSAAAAFLAAIPAVLARGAFALDALSRATVDAAALGGFVFLGGFFASVAVGIPLFKALEKIRLRTAWPYVGAALIVEIAALAAVLGRWPLEPANPLASLLRLLPGVLIALVFAARMRPHWRLADLADKADQTPLRLH